MNKVTLVLFWLQSRENPVLPRCFLCSQAALPALADFHPIFECLPDSKAETLKLAAHHLVTSYYQLEQLDDFAFNSTGRVHDFANQTACGHAGCETSARSAGWATHCQVTFPVLFRDSGFIIISLMMCCCRNTAAEDSKGQSDVFSEQHIRLALADLVGAGLVTFFVLSKICW
jgi:hypothetical protein